MRMKLVISRLTESVDLVIWYLTLECWIIEVCSRWKKWSVLNLKERKTLNRSDSKSWIQSQGFMFTPTFLHTTWIQIKSWFHSTHSLTKYTFTFFKPIIIHHFSNNFQTIKSWKEVKDGNKAVIAVFFVLPSPNSFLSFNPNLELFSRFFYLKIKIFKNNSQVITVINFFFKMKIHIFTVLILASLASEYNSWPTGAPEEACESLTPQHGSNRAKPPSQSPFTVTQSQNSFEPGDRIKG